MCSYTEAYWYKLFEIIRHIVWTSPNSNFSRFYFDFHIISSLIRASKKPAESLLIQLWTNWPIKGAINWCLFGFKTQPDFVIFNVWTKKKKDCLAFPPGKLRLTAKTNWTILSLYWRVNRFIISVFRKFKTLQNMHFMINDMNTIYWLKTVLQCCL